MDLQDQPVANATISVSGYGDGQPDHLSAQTDAQGRFTLKGVCQGRVNIRAEVNQGNRRLSANALTDGGSTDIKIVLREGSLVHRPARGRQELRSDRLRRRQRSSPAWRWMRRVRP